MNLTNIVFIIFVTWVSNLHKCSDSIKLPNKEILLIGSDTNEICNERLIKSKWKASIKDSLRRILVKDSSKYKIYDINTFISYIPDSLETLNDSIKKKHFLCLKRKLYHLAELYRIYDDKINSPDQLGVLTTAKQFLTTQWEFNPNFKVPYYCTLVDSIHCCWELPSDLKNLKEKKKISGMPYCWGGKSLFENFKLNIDKSYAPGDICGKSKCNEIICKSICNGDTNCLKYCLKNRVDSNKSICINPTTGIDCSGFIVQCFKLCKYCFKSDANLGTWDLAKSNRFDSIGKDILSCKVGDLILKPGTHVGFIYSFQYQKDDIKVMHSGTSNFFKKNGKKILGLDQGVRLDSSNRKGIISLFESGYSIYRLSIKAHTYKQYKDTLTNILLNYAIN